MSEYQAHQRSVEALLTELHDCEHARDLAIADAAAYALYVWHLPKCASRQTAGAPCSCGYRELMDLTDQHAGEQLMRELHTSHETLAQLVRDRDAQRREHESLLTAATDLVNDLTALRMPDPSALWIFGGKPLERDYLALKAALEQAAKASER